MTFNPLRSLTLAAAAALLAHTSANAAESVAERALTEIYQPTLRASQLQADKADKGARSSRGVSLLDGIVRDWRDPSRAAREQSAPGPRSATGGNVALEKLREVYAASSAD